MTKQVKSGISILLKQAIVTVLLGGGITVGLFYLAAVAIVSRNISQSVFYLFATVAICAGCFCSSIILALQRKSKGLLCGLMCFFVFVVIILFGFLLSNSRVFSAAAILRIVLLCVSGCAGGCIGVNKVENRLRRRKRM